jgi:hypothetical protein
MPRQNDLDKPWADDICQDPESDISGSWHMSSAHGLPRSLISDRES